MSRRPRSVRPSRSSGLRQRPFGEVRNPYRPMEILSVDQIEVIHEKSLMVLRDIGLKVDSAVARDLLAAAGADVDRSTGRVRFEPAMVEAKSIPTKSKLSNNDWWILGGIGLVASGVAIYYWGYYLPKKKKDESS